MNIEQNCKPVVDALLGDSNSTNELGSILLRCKEELSFVRREIIKLPIA